MRAPDSKSPVERMFNLAGLSDAGYETAVAASPEELARLASWAGVNAVRRFDAKIFVNRLSSSRFAYRAELEAEVAQSCVVTLDPVLLKISLAFGRTLQIVPKLRRPLNMGGELNPAAGDDDVPEQIAGTRYDLVGPLLEEFSLAIEPYPHAPGVVFESPAEAADIRETPFARLKVLKGDR
jgi:hypothetical protein